jgi:hypothetical protein
MSDEPEVYQAGNPRHVAEATRKAKRDQDDRDAAMVQTMQTKMGRQWMWHLLSMCGVFRTSFSSDLAVMARGEGMRIVGLALMSDLLRVASGEYVTMTNENSVKVK